MTKNVWMVRGTGFKTLDGSLVTVIDHRGDGTVAVVPFGHTNFKPIIIDSRCIQSVDNKKTFKYEFKIWKSEEGNLAAMLESKSLIIPEALRDVSLDTIIEYITNHLQPLLKLE